MSPQASERAGARPERRGTGRAPLSVVDKKAVARRARQRRERLLLVVSGLVLAGSLGLVAGAEGLVTSQQEHLDGLDQRIATAVSTTQSLELSKATLEAPSRILGIAERQLHMVTPSHVTYLAPVQATTVSSRQRRSSR